MLTVLGLVLGSLAIGVAYWLISPRLPDVAEIREIRLQVPLRVLSADGRLVAVFGETRRTPIGIAEIPRDLKNAFIAIEDSRFYEHPGIDVIGIARAVWLLATTDRERVPGGSTITQQVARGFFLSSEYSFTRKLTEIFLALRLERELTKDEIFELYLNKIFFGYRAYGVVAAADFYYGKPLDQLSLAECAMLAAIPKFPSSGNPLNDPARALLRRDYVLQRMLEEGLIDEARYAAAHTEPDRAHPHEPPVEIEAPYLAEMIRLAAIERLGNEALTSGYTVYSTIDSRLQTAANASVHQGLIAYDRRHGWRGPEAHVELAPESGPAEWGTELAAYRPLAGLVPGVVTESGRDSATVHLADGSGASLGIEAVRWAKPYLSEHSRGPAPQAVDTVVKRGDIVRLSLDKDGKWQLGQLPKAQGALVSLDPDNGRVMALVGGFSFAMSKFNRAVQSTRQPGSSFKPFMYSAAFERGFNPASIVNDAPLVFADPSREDGLWKPSNDDDSFLGPMRLREAMVRSRNLVSVRLLDAIGVRYARDYMTHFGFPLEALPENLSLALGSSSVPPILMARGYAVFANGGYLVEPYFLGSIVDDQGRTVFQATPATACGDCAADGTGGTQPASDAADLSALLGNAPAAVPDPAVTPSAAAPATGTPTPAPRAIDERNAYLVTSLLQDVVRRGTGRGAMVLGRNDLAGKTGTTNEHRDAWFSGFNRHLVATAWIGFDEFTSLGKGEFAAQTALPVWIGFMKVALDGVPDEPYAAPPGIATARIDAATGLALDPSMEGGVVEVFKAEDIARLAALRSETGRDEAEQQALEIF
jgi:penicillin-binding protein 1A